MLVAVCAVGRTAELTLDKALALAEVNSPLIEESKAVQAGAGAGIVAAKAYPNPQFNFLAGHQAARPITMPAVPGPLQHYSVSQPMETPGVRRTRLQAARLGLESSTWGVRGTRVALVAHVKHAFYEVLHRKEEIDHTRESLALVEDLRRRVAVQVGVGEVGRLELTRAEAEIAIAQTALKGAQLRYVGAVAALRVATGASPTGEINPVGNLDTNVAVPPLDAARVTVLENHPAIGQARTEMQRAQALLANEKALRVPQYAVYGEYEHQPDLTFYRAGVNIPLPLWNRRKGEIEAASAEVRRAAAVEAQRRLELIAALERAYSQFQLADGQVKSFQAGSLRQAEAALTAAQAAYRFGERGIIEVLDAQRVLQSVRGDYLDVRFEREDALIDLEELGAVSGIGDGK